MAQEPKATSSARRIVSCVNEADVRRVRWAAPRGRVTRDKSFEMPAAQRCDLYDRRSLQLGSDLDKSEVFWLLAMAHLRAG